MRFLDISEEKKEILFECISVYRLGSPCIDEFLKNHKDETVKEIIKQVHGDESLSYEHRHSVNAESIEKIDLICYDRLLPETFVIGYVNTGVRDYNMYVALPEIYSKEYLKNERR